MEKIKLFNSNGKLSFHECKICNIDICDGKLYICLAEKCFYAHDQEYNSIIICVHGLEVNKEYVSLSISTNKKGKVKEITIKELKRLLLTNNLVVYLDYYSYFSKSLLLKGTINSMEIEIIISEITEISLLNEKQTIGSFVI